MPRESSSRAASNKFCTNVSMPQLRNKEERLPICDPKSMSAQKENSRHRSSNSGTWIHVIPLILFICWFMLWWFSHHPGDVVPKDDSKFPELRLMVLPLYDTQNNLPTIPPSPTPSITMVLQEMNNGTEATTNLTIRIAENKGEAKKYACLNAENAEREMRSMEGTLNVAMELLTEVLLQFLVPLSQNSGFRTFWLGVLRRMDTCVKANLGDENPSRLQELVPLCLKKIIIEMKEKEILVQKEGLDLWEITYVQIQWIVPSLKEELFPEEEL